MDNDVSSWMTQLEANIDTLEKAKTKDEKIKAAENMVGTIRALK